MGTVNKRHNRKITRPCPVCGGKVIVCHRNVWWVACEATNQIRVRNHIPQLLLGSAKEAIEIWNRYGNELTNGEKIRRMPDWEIRGFLCRFMDCDQCSRNLLGKERWSFDDPDCHDMLLKWLESPPKGEQE